MARLRQTITTQKKPNREPKPKHTSKPKRETKPKSKSKPQQPDIDLTAQPTRMRVALWMLFGAALGLPVDALFKIFSLQMAKAKRQLKGKYLRMMVAERLVFGHVAKQLGSTFKELFDWIVSPDAFIRWAKRYQERQANAAKKPKKLGRPWISQKKVDAILRIYDAGFTGLKRIVGEMTKNKMKVAKSTVRKVLTRHGRAPTDSNRSSGSTWWQFWTRHAPYLVGIDFLQIPVGLLNVRNCFVFFGVEHDTRKVHILGFDFFANDVWVANVIRSATMDGEPLAARKYWVHDNDGRYAAEFRKILKDRTLKPVKTSIRAPDMNAIAERWVKSIKEECLNHVVMLNEQMLRDHVMAYAEHYNSERPHQGIGNVPIGPWEASDDGELVCDERLGGLLKSFRRAA